ncbi:MAG TPA: prepilin-type N-terminal cleavage/methylation domain-containing protein [Planctomycetota bacterium]|nr:prepilin-type N-terminal cleavage/methylation domain-containing protein [Planctomycetota bacterium]
MNRKRAFSLAEVVLVMTISSILFLSLSAALSGTLSTTAEVSAQVASWQAVSAAALKIERELTLATSVASMQNRLISFYVPDITGDSVNDLIEYSWSGLADAPLVRKVNNGSDTHILPQVQSLAFTYNYRDRNVVKISSATRELAVTPAYFNAYSGSASEVVTTAVKPASWRGQWFTPLTIAHRVDAISLRAMSTSLFGFGQSNLNIALVEKSTGRTMATGLLSRFDIVYYSMRTFVVPMTWQDGGGSALATDNEYRWAFTPAGNSYAGDLEALRITDGSSPSNSTMYEYSTDSGGTWLNLGNQVDLRFVTYATYTLAYGINTAQTESKLRRVQISLTYGTGKHAASISTAVRLANL